MPTATTNLGNTRGERSAKPYMVWLQGHGTWMSRIEWLLRQKSEVMRVLGNTVKRCGFSFVEYDEVLK